MTVIERIREKLDGVIDPGTGVGVAVMGLIKHLAFEDATGKVSLTFAPSSPVCPMAFKLAADIAGAVGSVEEVRDMKIRVENHSRAREIEELLSGEQSPRG